MCLIIFAWRQHPDYPLVMAANRDEFHARPAEPMGWWSDRPTVLAGRDLEAGGTWLGVSRSGHIAAVTNYRENLRAVGEQSRGDIVTTFVSSGEKPSVWLSGLDGDRYAGFSALAADGHELAYRSNRGDATRRLMPGVYGLSNASLDTPWPKLVRTRERLDRLIADSDPGLDELFELVADTDPARDDEISDTDLPTDVDPAMSAPFINMPDYGTRCSTALVCRADGHVEIAERRFDAAGRPNGDSRFVFLAPLWQAQSRP